MTIKYLTFSLLVHFVYLTKLGVLGSPQYITFFEGSNCNGATGRNETITDATRDDLNDSWISEKAMSMLIVGLWKVNIKKDIGGGQQQGVTIIHFLTQPPTGRCVDKSSWTDLDWQNFHFYYVDRLGSTDMTTSEVTFFTENLFEGLRYTMNQDVGKVSPRPFTMLSYVHLSNETWAVYPQEHFTGTPIYLRPQAGQNAPEDYYSYNPRTTILVGSVKKGIPVEEKK